MRDERTLFHLGNIEIKKELSDLRMSFVYNHPRTIAAFVLLAIILVLVSSLPPFARVFLISFLFFVDMYVYYISKRHDALYNKLSKSLTELYERSAQAREKINAANKLADYESKMDEVKRMEDYLKRVREKARIANERREHYEVLRDRLPRPKTLPRPRPITKAKRKQQFRQRDPRLSERKEHYINPDDPIRQVGAGSGSLATPLDPTGIDYDDKRWNI